MMEGGRAVSLVPIVVRGTAEAEDFVSGYSTCIGFAVINDNVVIKDDIMQMRL